MDYKSALSYSKAYCNEKNKGLLAKYVKHFDDRGLKYGDLENFKNCLMFAGALFDEMNDGLPEWKLEQRYHTRLEHQGKIRFNSDNMEVIEKNLEYLCGTLKKIDAKNAQQYDNVCLAAKQVLNDIYEEQRDESKTF